MPMTSDRERLMSEADELYAILVDGNPTWNGSHIRERYRAVIDTYTQAIEYSTATSFDELIGLIDFAIELIKKLDRLFNVSYPNELRGQQKLFYPIYKHHRTIAGDLYDPDLHEEPPNWTGEGRSRADLEELKTWCKKASKAKTSSITNRSGDNDSSREAKDELPLRELQAYRSYTFAAEKIGGQPTDRQAYDLLKDDGYEDYVLPSFDTWTRYVREGRRHFGQQKNSPRAGRSHGSSIVEASQIESLAPITSQVNSEAD